MQIDKTEFQAQITYYMKKRGIKGLNELSESTLISYKTLLKYWKDPERFPLGEVGRILDTLRIPSEEFLDKIIIESGGVKNEAEKDIRNSIHYGNRSNHDRNRKPCVDIGSIRPIGIKSVTN